MRLNMKKRALSNLSLAIIFLAVISSLRAGIPVNGPVRVLFESSGQDFFWYAPNRIGTYISNVGELVSFRVIGNAGMEWPVGSGNTINFQSGLWIGGMVGSQIRTAVAEYTVEFGPGTYEDWKNGDDPKYKIYTITRDDTIDTPGDDYLNWPFEDGAPMLLDESGNIILDNDGNMIPGLIGDMLSWSVFNDADTTAHSSVFNTFPLGLEVQQTIWAFDREDAFGDMMFMKYLIINKGGNLIEDTYLSFWADIDLGSATDDLVGADTVLSLGYSYNDGADNIYGAAPPAIGYDFFQGPIVESVGDTAKVSRHFRSSGIVPGFRNLPMTSLAHYEGGGPAGSGDPENAQQMYWFQQGLDGLGNVKIDPTTNQPTTFSYPGDPVTGEGWIRTDAKDLRFMLSTGPFTMAPGDTQELVGGIIIAQGTSALNSMTKLKAADKSAQIAYDSDFKTFEIVAVDHDESNLPFGWSLQENYPNPFNPSTTIEYSLHQPGDVSLIVYNLLGEEVARLVNEAHQAGNYKISWDASNISSGIYFYRLQVRQTGGRASDFIETKKMLLLK